MNETTDSEAQPVGRGHPFHGLLPVILLIAFLLAMAEIFGGEAIAATLVLIPMAAVAHSGMANARRSLARRGRRPHTILIVGRNRRTRNHLRQLMSSPFQHVSVVGILDIEDGRSGESDCTDLQRQFRVPFLGGVGKLHDVLKQTPVDEVLITLPIKSCYDVIQGVVHTCEQAGVSTSMCADLFETRIARPEPPARSIGAPCINYTCVPHPSWKLAIKRTIDIAGALTALAIFSVPMLIIAAAIKLTSKGPLFFRQRRVGLNHKPFNMLKFRTMVVNAEELKEKLRHLNEVEGPVFKIRKDPRVTPIGRLLRRTSLDELPQLFNVLRGDMSLVGPRPPVPQEVSEYEWWQRRRLSMKPGITCIWQVSGRSNIPFDKWMQLDLRYIDNWSLFLDLKLLLRTIPVVVRGDGAS